MRTSAYLWLVAGLLAAPALAQNAAPVQNDVPAHVAPSQAQTATSQAADARQTAAAGAPEGQAKVLDSVVAIVNGEVLLESDVQQEQRLESLQMLPAGENTAVRAAQHLVTRTLIVQQMKAQQETSPEITDADVSKVIAEMRKDLPGCAAAHCESDAGWARFLAERSLSPDEVRERWRQRLVILDYLNLRFRSGIRIPPADVQKYYEANLLPEFHKKHQTPPPVKSLAPRIQEILLQQQVTKQIDDWETTLRQQGSVQILVPAYGESTNNQDDDMGSGA
ncbi:MAG TPA: peptidylprolyl isomerase [Acidobacteriaceae bacterium]